VADRQAKRFLAYPRLCTRTEASKRRAWGLHDVGSPEGVIGGMPSRGPKIIPKEKPRSSRGRSKRRGLACLASGRLVRVSARSNRRPRFGLYRFGPITSADCCERRKCVAAIFAVRDAPAHDEPHSGPNNSEREPTSGRSTKYGSGHLIRVFRDIGRISSLLFLLSHPSASWSPAETEGSKAEDAIWFRRRQKWFQLCFVRNSSRVPPKEDPARVLSPMSQGRGSREPSVECA
jgi:hypothetical protein